MSNASTLPLAALLLVTSLAAQDTYRELQNWRVHTGDEARFADPGFDDSNWQPLPSFPSRQ